jgi:REP element-mobilizing transposase RayT
MANTYTQLYAQIIFAVKHRQNLILLNHREEVQKYITGIVTNKDQKLISIFANPDHLHVLVGMKPSISISELTRDIKAGSSKFINEQGWMKTKFSWQDGFGAFSYSKSQLPEVIRYIENQEEHHRRQNFKDEYIDLLKKFDVEYNERYLFDWII